MLMSLFYPQRTYSTCMCAHAAFAVLHEISNIRLSQGMVSVKSLGHSSVLKENRLRKNRRCFDCEETINNLV